MTTEEFSNEFDTLLSSYSQQLSMEDNTTYLEFDEYEKSVFLTTAQESIIRDFYNGKNIFQDSFEKTEEIRRILSSLVKTYKTSYKESGKIGLSNHSTFFKLPLDLWFITYEAVNLKDESLGCNSGENITVIPVTQDEYHRIKKNPYRNANERKALRLDVDEYTIEIISKYNIETYLLRYLSKPNPIILTDLTDDTSINGINKKTECELNPVIHRVILEGAVRLALLSRTHTGKQH